MLLKKKLVLENDDIPKEILFGILNNTEEIEEYNKLRFHVYDINKYIDTSMYKSEIDIDDYDRNNKCIYFGITYNRIIIGGVRLIQDEILPMEKNFRFVFNNFKISECNRESVAEIGRLVIDYEKVDFKLPKNILLAFLFTCVVSYSNEKKLKVGLAFIKKRLMEKLLFLGAPIVESDSHRLLDVSNSPMYKYFYDNKNPAIPCFFFFEQMNKYLTRIISNKLIFINNGSNEYRLKKSPFNSFLRTLGVL